MRNPFKVQESVAQKLDRVRGISSNEIFVEKIQSPWLIEAKDSEKKAAERYEPGSIEEDKKWITEIETKKPIETEEEILAKYSLMEIFNELGSESGFMIIPLGRFDQYKTANDFIINFPESEKKNKNLGIEVGVATDEDRQIEDSNKNLKSILRGNFEPVASAEKLKYLEDEELIKDFIPKIRIIATKENVNKLAKLAMNLKEKKLSNGEKAELRKLKDEIETQIKTQIFNYIDALNKYITRERMISGSDKMKIEEAKKYLEKLRNIKSNFFITK